MKNFVTLFLLLLVANFSISAQSMIEGTILNENGDGVPDVTILVKHTAKTEFAQVVQTDDNGYFMVNDLIDGNYELVAKTNNYETLLINDFQFPRDTDQVVGLTLENLITSSPTVVTSNQHAAKNDLLATY